MKHMGKMFGLVFLLVVGFAIAPATGSIYEATEQQINPDKNIEIEFWDFTNQVPIKTTIELPQSQWNSIKNELDETKEKASSVEDQLTQQLAILNNHNLISKNVDGKTLRMQAFTRSISLYGNNAQKLLPRGPFLNNSLISAMCAINFELTNGTTIVLGLNSFINLIGFNIVSVHKGYTPTGIDAKGLISKTTTAGEFFGFMFGFLGYWYGEKISTGQYSTLTAAGFTVITGWFPVPELP